MYLELLLLFLGSFSGFFAGLFGIGGGALLVPSLYYILQYCGYGDNAMHIAIGTSLLTIIFTGCSSGIAHFKHGLVDLDILKNYIPGIFLGVFLGTYMVNFCPDLTLKFIFAITQLIFGIYMISNLKKKIIFTNMPSQPWLICFSTASSCLSTMTGGGGGIQNVMFMTICNVNIKKAIATAAAMGPIIAIVGCVGFIAIGLSDQNLPPSSLGYLNINMFIYIIITSIFTAPLGAKLAHKLPVGRLKKYFSIFTLGIATKMFIEVAL